MARAVTVPRHVGHPAPLALPGHGQLRCASSGLLGEALHRASDWRSLATVFALYQHWRSGTPPRKPPWPCCLYRLHRCHDPKPSLNPKTLTTANPKNSGTAGDGVNQTWILPSTPRRRTLDGLPRVMHELLHLHLLPWLCLPARQQSSVIPRRRRSMGKVSWLGL